jgi:hypothetical protein
VACSARALCRVKTRILCGALFFFLASHSLLADIVKLVEVPASVTEPDENSAFIEYSPHNPGFILLVPLAVTSVGDEIPNETPQFALRFIEIIKERSEPFDLAVIFFDPDNRAGSGNNNDNDTNNDDPFADSVQAILDRYDLGNKTVAVYAGFSESPAGLSAQQKTFGKKPPLEVVRPFFSVCKEAMIPASFSAANFSLAGFEDFSALIETWDYDFPLLALGDGRNAAPEITAEQLADFLAQYAETVLSDPNDDYDRHYTFFKMGETIIFVPEYTMILGLLFGMAILFFCLLARLSFTKRNR